jgi:tRNA (guanosine-2'-O-)-methyltransferase
MSPRQLDGTGMKRLHREWRRRTPGRLALVLDGLQGPFNVGAIVRTAAALRVDHLWVAGQGARPGDAKVAKTALGTDRYLEWSPAEDALEAIDAARAGDYRVVAVELADGAEALHDLDLTGDVCLVIGHEDRGLAPAVLGACDAVGFIPQLGRVGSLNVATATAIACYEVRRRAWSTGETPSAAADDDS